MQGLSQQEVEGAITCGRSMRWSSADNTENDKLHTGDFMRRTLAFVLTRSLFCAAACAGVAGCVTSMNLTLQPRGNGDLARGVVKHEGHQASINIDGRDYEGTWAIVQGGSFSLASLSGGGRFATGTGFSASATGDGNIIARSSDGHSVHCVFSYSQMSESGAGVCQDSSAAVYDLQISR
jgi:hypothetical protein